MQRFLFDGALHMPMNYGVQAKGTIVEARDVYIRCRLESTFGITRFEAVEASCNYRVHPTGPFAVDTFPTHVAGRIYVCEGMTPSDFVVGN